MKETLTAWIEENCEPEYKEFSKKFTFTEYPIKGVRLPKIKNYAKTLVKSSINPDDIIPGSHEEVLLKAFMINYTKADFDTYKKRTHDYISYIDNWATCDSFVTSAKWIRKYKKEYFKDVVRYTKSSRNYYQRYGLVVLLSYYMDDEYIDQIFEIIATSNYHDYYYSKMAAAWLLSYCFIHYFDRTKIFVTNRVIDSFVLKKGIQKSLESYRVSDDNKLILRSLRNSLG